MRIVHSIYFGFVLLIDLFERNREFSTGRAINIMTLIFALVLASIFDILFSYIYCNRVAVEALLIISFLLSFFLNEYYFTYKGRGDQIVEQSPRIVNNWVTIILAVFSAFFCFYFLGYSLDFSKTIISCCE